MQDIIEVKEAYGVIDFNFICKHHIESAVSVLNSTWVPSIQDVFIQVSIFFNIS